MKYTLRLEYDPDVECPNSDYAWKLISFHRKHINYQSPEKFIKALDANGEVIPAEVGLREKLENGTAYILSYYEHGGCVWSLKGSGPQCRWDTAQIAGLLLWEGEAEDLPQRLDQRREAAQEFLQV